MQSKRLGELPPYLFVEIDRQKEEFARSGRTVLDLGIGDPDLGAPRQLKDSLIDALENNAFDRYPSDRGYSPLIEAICGLAEQDHGVKLDPGEVLVTIGSKEAIAHLPLAVADPGDIVLVPDPGYPVYNSSAIFAGAVPHRIPLLAENGFFPDFRAIEDESADKAKLIYLNYPNNPTSAGAGDEKFGAAIDFCRESDTILVNDAAYGEIVYGDRSSPLFPLARNEDIPYIEFFSFSKTLSVTGWRIGYAVGSPEVISALARLKANIDSGVFTAVQAAVARVLCGDYHGIVSRIIDVYSERRDILADGLDRSGLDFTLPGATFYFWIPVPGGGSSIDFCRRLLEDTGIVATPGVGFGANGEGYFRLSITAPTGTIRQAAEKFAQLR